MRDEAGAMWCGGMGDAVARVAVQWDVTVGVLPVCGVELCDGAGVADPPVCLFWLKTLEEYPLRGSQPSPILLILRSFDAMEVPLQCARRASQRGLDEGLLEPYICAADTRRPLGRCDGHRSVFGAALPEAVRTALIQKSDWRGHWSHLSENTDGAG